MTTNSIDFNKLNDKEKIKQLTESTYTHPELAKIIQTFAKTPEEFILAIRLYSYMPPTMNFPEKINSTAFNISQRQKRIPIDLPGYNLKYTTPIFDAAGNTPNIHPENGMQIEISKANSHERIGTINFYYTSDNKKTNIRINNIQGSRTKIQELTNLTNELKENWRAAIVKKIVTHGKTHQINVIGELPCDYVANPKEYIRYARQYIQTYIKAGINPASIDSQNIMIPSFREQFEKILKTKKANIEKEKLNLLKAEKRKQKKVFRTEVNKPKNKLI